MSSNQMNKINLKVTSKVLAQVGKASNQQQIAISEASGTISSELENCNKQNRIKITLANALELIVGDTRAIWRAHNIEHQRGFDSLFNLLSHQPDTEFTFLCEVVK
jgi:hypothetical protein